MVTRKRRNDKAPIDELGSDPEEAGSDSAGQSGDAQGHPEEAGSDSAGQSGDAQGLSQIADADEESVEELAETDQPYEAGVVDGLEDAADHPERATRTRENKGR